MTQVSIAQTVTNLHAAQSSSAPTILSPNPSFLKPATHTHPHKPIPTPYFQKLDRPTKQQPAFPHPHSHPNPTSISSNPKIHPNQYIPKSLNGRDPRATPTDQDIHQLWQTMRSVLTYNHDLDSSRSNPQTSQNTSFHPFQSRINDPFSNERLGMERSNQINLIPRPPPANFSTRPATGNRSKNPTSLSLAEQKLVQSLERLDNRLYEIEMNSSKKDNSARY